MLLQPTVNGGRPGGNVNKLLKKPGRPCAAQIHRYVDSNLRFYKIVLRKCRLRIALRSGSIRLGSSCLLTSETWQSCEAAIAPPGKSTRAFWMYEWIKA